MELQEENKMNPCEKNQKLYRQYTLTGEKDYADVLNGLCPEYALSWRDDLNARFWPPNHDFKGPTYEKRKIIREIRYIIQAKLNKIKHLNRTEYYPVYPQPKRVQFAIFNEIYSVSPVSL